MGNSIKFSLFFSTLLASVFSAPYPSPQDQPGPFAAIGNFIQRLQTSFNEGSDSIRQSNNVIPFAPSPLVVTNATNATTTTIRTTTTSPPPTSLFSPATNPFNSINAILDNIGRSSTNNNLDKGNNNIFGSVPGRNLLDSTFTTPRPLPLTTSRPPFDLEGINQGINAFFQAFIKTNIEKLFRQGQDQQQHSITTRSDTVQQKPFSFGEIINSLFKRN